MFSHSKEIKIFSANANRPLAEAICQKLGVPMGDSVVKTFADGEVSVSINETVRGCDVFVIQSTCKPVNDSLMELLILVDALRRASAARITAVMPYFGYARQDRKAKARDPISAKLVANLITVAGADRVLTMDLHASQIQGFFDIPVDNLLGNPVFVKYYLSKFDEAARDEMVVVSPDVGSVARARAFAQKMGMGLAIVDKRRQKANSCEVMNIIGDVAGRDCILFDDMIDTAGSLCNACAAIREAGAKKIYGCASHGVFSKPALERIENSCFEEVRVLDTIPMPADYTGTKVAQLTVADMFAEAITRIDEETSISTLF
ncbi:MAG: ribose-phosphate pyrophosphokinase [Oscillospiraceae bacterium]|nr:ribose-phosphate pyrophosphokinase [Oscillospiraceae bacterium]